MIAVDINEEKLKELDNLPGKIARNTVLYCSSYIRHKKCTILGVITRKLDVLDKESISKLAEEYGPVDILFNCVG